MHEIICINASEKGYMRHNYLLTFGAYNDTRLYVYADSIEDALELCGDYLAANVPDEITVEGSDLHMDLIAEVCSERGIEYPAGWLALDDETQWEISDVAMTDSYRTEAGWIRDWMCAGEDFAPRELSDYVHNR